MWCCSSLLNVDALANFINLTSLNLCFCRSVKPEPSPNQMDTREIVDAYQERNEATKKIKGRILPTTRVSKPTLDVRNSHW